MTSAPETGLPFEPTIVKLNGTIEPLSTSPVADSSAGVCSGFVEVDVDEEDGVVLEGFVVVEVLVPGLVVVEVEGLVVFEGVVVGVPDGAALILTVASVLEPRTDVAVPLSSKEVPLPKVILAVPEAFALKVIL